MSVALIGGVDLTCYLCRCEFRVTRDLYDARKSDGRNFWCPNGHDQHFTETAKGKAEKEAARLRTLNASLMQDVERARSARKVAERRASAARGQVTKAKNRIMKGVCPCCNRYFAELHRHMTDKHPDWKHES